MTKKKDSEVGTERWGFGTIIFVIFSYILFAVVLVGLVQYFIARYNLLTFQTLELVTGIGLVGGFLFLAGFREGINDKLRRKLKGIGSLYLFSTISLSFIPYISSALFTFRPCVYVATFGNRGMAVWFAFSCCYDVYLPVCLFDYQE